MRSRVLSGWLPGREDDNWMQAERELLAGCVPSSATGAKYAPAVMLSGNEVADERCAGTPRLEGLPQHGIGAFDESALRTPPDSMAMHSTETFAAFSLRRQSPAPGSTSLQARTATARDQVGLLAELQDWEIVVRARDKDIAILGGDAPPRLRRVLSGATLARSGGRRTGSRAGHRPQPGTAPWGSVSAESAGRGQGSAYHRFPPLPVAPGRSGQDREVSRSHHATTRGLRLLPREDLVTSGRCTRGSQCTRSRWT